MEKFAALQVYTETRNLLQLQQSLGLEILSYDLFETILLLISNGFINQK